MQITEVQIKLANEHSGSSRLKAFCTITLDGVLVIHDIRIIENNKRFFVSMPSRKLTDHCSRCDAKNYLTAVFCDQCGIRLENNRAQKDPNGRTMIYADIAHPINSEFRELLEQIILSAYCKQLTSLQRA